MEIKVKVTVHPSDVTEAVKELLNKRGLLVSQAQLDKIAPKTSVEIECGMQSSPIYAGLQYPSGVRGNNWGGNTLIADANMGS